MTVGSCETNEAYKQTMHEFAGFAQDLYKKASALDSKVRRWQNTPEEALEITSRHRDIATALQAASQGFQLSAKKPPSVDKMQQAFDNLLQAGLEAELTQMLLLQSIDW
ncbi:ANKRD50 [Symbiodinium sp. CCMP2456]|nr:ANKRD50 [Symbiodinium sp. CCMP2456]